MKTSSSQTIDPVASLSLFLPSGILDYFTLVNHVSQDTCFILYLEETLFLLSTQIYIFTQKVSSLRLKFRTSLSVVKPFIYVSSVVTGKIHPLGRHIVVTGVWLHWIWPGACKRLRKRAFHVPCR